MPTDPPIDATVGDVAHQATFTLTFFDLTLDPTNDPIWVTLRNPLILSSWELAGLVKTLGMGDNPSACSVAAWLITDWRVYDAAAPLVDPLTGDEIADPRPSLLPMPATPALVARAPLCVVRAISDQVWIAAHRQH